MAFLLWFAFGVIGRSCPKMTIYLYEVALPKKFPPQLKRQKIFKKSKPTLINPSIQNPNYSTC